MRWAISHFRLCIAILVFAPIFVWSLLFFPISKADASLETCVRACLDPIPSTPTNPTNPAGSKVFPGQIIFENQSDVATGQYAGKALIMLPAAWYGRVLSVGLNGETGFRDEYKGQPVFRYTKEGSQYPRPLKIIITAIDGQVYTATSGSTPTAPTGKNQESVKPSSCGNPPGASCRQNMRLMHTWDHYGLTPAVNCDGDKYVIKNSSKRQEEPGGWIWKPVADSPNSKGIKGVVIVGKHGKKYNQCTVTW